MNRKEGHNDFNVYYMNFSKVYEIAMMINNQIVKLYQREKGQQVEDTYSLDIMGQLSLFRIFCRFSRSNKL